MKMILFIFSILFIQSSYAGLNSFIPFSGTEETCDLLNIGSIESLLPSKLTKVKSRSPLWAQEYVGADLAKEYIRSLDYTSLVPTTIFDRGFVLDAINKEKSTFANKPTLSDNKSSKVKYHGTLVANIINGDGPYSITEQVKLTSLNTVVSWHQTFAATDKIMKRSKLPRLMNMSMQWAGQVYHFQELADEGVIIVTTSGNKAPRPIMESKETFEDAIIVGSMSTVGFRSKFSQESEKVTILAPSDYSILSKGPENVGLIGFNGTSGAAPVVSGSLANVMSILPKISIEDAKILLKRTAVKTATTLPEIKKNGAGMVNTYKLARIAGKIFESCKKEDNPVSCHKNMIREDSTYDFSSGWATLEEKLRDNFPLCFKTPITIIKGCDGKAKAFKELRKYALLNQDSWKPWDTLSCIHRSMGKRINARFYQHVGLLNHPNRMDILSKVMESADIRRKKFVLRMAMTAKSPEFEPIILDATNDENEGIKKKAEKHLKMNQ